MVRLDQFDTVLSGVTPTDVGACDRQTHGYVIERDLRTSLSIVRVNPGNEWSGQVQTDDVSRRSR